MHRPRLVMTVFAVVVAGWSASAGRAEPPPVPEGMKTQTIPFDPVLTFVRAGDHVDVMVVERMNGKSKAWIVVRNVAVREATADRRKSVDGKTPGVGRAELLVTPLQAEVLRLLETTSARLRLIVLSKE